MGTEHGPRPITRMRDGRAWRIATSREVAWLGDRTSVTTAITAAIPPVFHSYATLELPGTDGAAGPAPGGVAQHRHDDALVAVLARHATPQPWWLGYLDTGSADIVFPDAPRVMLYAGWPYVVVEAGPQQAATWRRADPVGLKGPLPDLMFPEDRSWLVSTLWDDDWTCIGGSEALVADLSRDPELGSRTRPVALDHDATPPGHVAR